jgi:gas vesicle protein
MNKENENGIACLVIGFGLGLLAGLLWAPRRSQEIRAGLRSSATAGLNLLTAERAKLRSETQRWLDIIKERIYSRANGSGAQRNHGE